MTDSLSMMGTFSKESGISGGRSDPISFKLQIPCWLGPLFTDSYVNYFCLYSIRWGCSPTSQFLSKWDSQFKVFLEMNDVGAYKGTLQPPPEFKCALINSCLCLSAWFLVRIWGLRSTPGRPTEKMLLGKGPEPTINWCLVGVVNFLRFYSFSSVIQKWFWSLPPVFITPPDIPSLEWKGEWRFFFLRETFPLLFYSFFYLVSKDMAALENPSEIWLLNVFFGGFNPDVWWKLSGGNNWHSTNWLSKMSFLILQIKYIQFLIRCQGTIENQFWIPFEEIFIFKQFGKVWQFLNRYNRIQSWRKN